MGDFVVTAEDLAAKFAVLLPHLDERQRRLVLAAEARMLGRGGGRAVARATGVREATVSRGVTELDERLADDRWAVLLKAHHSIVDGVSGITLFETFCDPATAGSDRQAAGAESAADPATGLFDLVAKGLRVSRGVPRLVFDTVRGLAPVVLGALLPGAQSSLNGPIGQQRRYAVARASLSAVHEVGEAFGVTVNDVALTVVTSAFRDVLLQRGEEPTADKLRILVPVSVRFAAAKLVLDNRISIMLPYLPVQIVDLVDQLDVVHYRMSRHKANGDAEAAKFVLSLTRWLPFAPVAWTVRLASRYPQRGISAAVTNVPGPKHQLYQDGREVLEILAYVPIAMRIRIGIAILSYRDQLVFGITGDYDTTSDIDLIADRIEQGIAELMARARIPRILPLGDAVSSAVSDNGSRQRKSPSRR